jgi:hypothetical protein
MFKNIDTAIANGVKDHDLIDELNILSGSMINLFLFGHTFEVSSFKLKEEF